MKQNNHPEKRPLYVRVICWILIILLLTSAIYYTIWGLSALISAIRGDGAETKSASLPHSAAVLEAPLQSERLLI